MPPHPASDGLVSAQAILDAQLQIRRQGRTAVLEQREPELASHIMENGTLLHQHLMELGAKARPTQRLFVEHETLLLTALLALRNAHYELWRQSAAATPLAALDPALPQAPPAPETSPAPPPSLPRAARDGPVPGGRTVVQCASRPSLLRRFLDWFL